MIHRGMTQETLGLRAGLEQAYVGDIERGTRNPTVWVLRRLASALDTVPSEILEAAEGTKD